MNNLFILHVVHFRFIGADIDVLNTGVAAIKIIKKLNQKIESAIAEKSFKSYKSYKNQTDYY